MFASQDSDNDERCKQMKHTNVKLQSLETPFLEKDSREIEINSHGEHFTLSAFWRKALTSLLIVFVMVLGCEERESDDLEVETIHKGLTGLEGTFEFAIDAPWRMEPEVVGSQHRYGAIPIYMNVLDMDTMHLDSANMEEFGNVQSLRITPYVDGVRWGNETWVSWRRFAEIDLRVGYWDLTGGAPQRWRCYPEVGDCSNWMLTPAGTSEWHALYWYNPPSPVAKGTDVVLKFELFFSAGEVVNGAEEVRLENWARVHYGEDPLPRFDGWAYGDLHYHSNGTDNESESGYSYPGTIRALGALGIDFALAAEHASDSAQLVDVDLEMESDLDADLCFTARGLRDMNSARFDYALTAQLNGPFGATKDMERDIARGYAPMLAKTNGRIPKILLGGEVDVLPEVTRLPNYASWDPDDPTWYLEYGNDQTIFLGDPSELCDGWQKKNAAWIDINFQLCDVDMGDGYCPTGRNDWFHWNGESYFIHDHQGVHQTNYFTRQHLVHIPAKPAQGQFVSSSTSRYGGATRRLVGSYSGSPLPGVLDEIETKKGYAFLAHPLSHGGNYAGPGELPYTDFQLERAFRSSTVLGLQFWNGNARFKSVAPKPHRALNGSCLGVLVSGFEIGYTYQNRSYFPTASGPLFDNIFALRPMCTDVIPEYFFCDALRDEAKGEACDATKQWRWEEKTEGPIKSLQNGAVVWDRMLRWGLQEERTEELDWLAPGEPRRVFMAGGSDAHGDFSYRRTGGVTYTESVNDNALAKVRNLVEVTPDENMLNTVEHETIVAAIADGRFCITDGPALRIAIDQNGNGVIDDGDASMGAIATTFSTSVNLLIEWETTSEFGLIDELEIYLGDRDQTWKIIPDRRDHRSSGNHRLAINLNEFSRSPSFYVRAFASTWRSDCSRNGDNDMREECVPHYAFTNPIWIQPNVALLTAIL